MEVAEAEYGFLFLQRAATTLAIGIISYVTLVLNSSVPRMCRETQQMSWFALAAIMVNALIFSHTHSLSLLFYIVITFTVSSSSLLCPISWQACQSTVLFRLLPEFSSSFEIFPLPLCVPPRRGHARLVDKLQTHNASNSKRHCSHKPWK